MSDPLLPYYNQELAFIRKLGAEFAEANPKVAGRLRMGAESVEDPHVSRLIEAFAYLNARTQHRLDDDFPEICEAVLSTLHPHYLAPLPSMAIIQTELAPSQAALAAGLHLPAGAPVETEPIDGEPCRFTTVYPVSLWPIEITHAGIHSQPFTAPSTSVSTDAAAVLRLRLVCQSPEVSFAAMRIPKLRLFLRGQQQYIHDLYQTIHLRTLAVALASTPESRPAAIYGPEAVRQVGFEADECLLGQGDRSAGSYELLTEFFAYPDKFMFVDLEFQQDAWEGMGRELEVFFYLEQTSHDLERHVGPENFRLGCTPMVNLFRRRAEPIRLSHTDHEYRVVPDARRPLSAEVYRVEQVTAVSPDGEEREHLPFYSVQHHEPSEAGRRYWHASRARAPREGEIDEGTEVYLSLVDLDFNVEAPADWIVDVDTVCLNRDLPQRLPYGGGQPQLWFRGAASVGSVRCVTPPTPTRRPQLRDGARWRLLSHLNLNHISLTHGADPLKEILSLYNFDASPQSQAIIDGIVDVSARAVTGRAGDGARRGICRGLEITVTFDPAKFAGSGVFLLASVLERFFARYATINSFTRLVAKLEGREGVLRPMAAARGRPHSGLDQQLLDAPREFDFFQAVRLLNAAARSAGRPQLGFDPAQEPLRFRGDIRLDFPPSDITALRQTPGGSQHELTVAFMGLVGSSGVLPRHYTRTIIERLRKRDRSLRDFLDLFLHRILTLHYQSWAKHRLPVVYEQGVRPPAELRGRSAEPRRRSAEQRGGAGAERHGDTFTTMLSALTGIASPACQQRLSFHDHQLRFFSGNFSRQVRSAATLQRMLEAMLRLPIEVQQFQGEWLRLEDADLPRLARGSQGRLGLNLNLGERVWSVQSRIRLRIGPVTRQQFDSLLPTGERLRKILDFVRMHVGLELEFDVQLVIRREESPRARLGGDSQPGTRLGWNGWLCTHRPDRDFEDAVFRSDPKPKPTEAA